MVHLHFNIVQKARLEFLKFIVYVKTFLDLYVSSCNTDGGIFITSLPFKSEYEHLPSIFQIDSFLKKSQSYSDLKQYIVFKNKYFENPNVCPIHTHEYITCLLNITPFTPKHCCNEYKTTDTSPYRIKIEIIGNKGMVLSINKSILIDKITNSIQFKCSGAKHHSFQDLIRNNKLDLESLFQQLSEEA